MNMKRNRFLVAALTGLLVLMPLLVLPGRAPAQGTTARKTVWNLFTAGTSPSGSVLPSGTSNSAKQNVTDASAIGVIGYLNVTANAGTAPTLALTIQDSPDGVTWFPLITFATVAAATNNQVITSNRAPGLFIRAQAVVGGSASPTYTFTCIAVTYYANTLTGSSTQPLFSSLTFTSPSTAGTTAQAPITGLGPYRSMTIFLSLQGATGGSLDTYIQYSPDGGSTWVDYAHLPYLPASQPAFTKVWSVAKYVPNPNLTIVGTGLLPNLAPNTIIGGDWGDRLRIVTVAGNGTSAGALETISLVLTS